VWGEKSLEEVLFDFLRKHWGKLLGVLLGLVVGLLMILIGFWKTIFILICIFIGYLLGKRIDEEGGISEWWERFFRKR